MFCGAMIFKAPPRAREADKMRPKMREMLTTVILGVRTLRPSILLRSLGMVVVFTLVCPVRSVHALNECSRTNYCGSGYTCCQDPDGTFRGCCFSGSLRYGPRAGARKVCSWRSNVIAVALRNDRYPPQSWTFKSYRLNARTGSVLERLAPSFAA
jgi:hypothetical protein